MNPITLQCLDPTKKWHSVLVTLDNLRKAFISKNYHMWINPIKFYYLSGV